MRLAKILSSLFIIVLFTYLFPGCQYNKADIVYPCDTTVVTYSVEIRAILDNNCKNCHGPDSSQWINSGYNLYDYTTISSLAFLDTANCPEGQLVAAVAHSACAFSFMPKGQPKLPDCDINLFRAWVSRGAPNN